MRKLGQALFRTIFWSYERGSWPYDLMVVTIVVFVLLTPRRWFHDQPESSYAMSSGVRLVSQDTDGQTRVYRLDAQILPPEKRTSKSTPELERETHDLLGRKVQELQDQTFQLVRIDPVRAANGSVLYYDVTLHM
jgi:hypothetical protein